VFSTVYQEFDRRKKFVKRNGSTLNYANTDERHTALNKQIMAASQTAGIDLELLDTKAFNQNQVDKFNDMALVNTWFTEVLNHDEVDRFIPSNYGEIVRLSDKYGTDYFANIGMFLALNGTEISGGHVVLVFFTWPLLPIYVARAVTPYKDAVTYNLVYDVRENRLVMLGLEGQSKKSSDKLLYKNMTWQLSQIKAKRSR